MKQFLRISMGHEPAFQALSTLITGYPLGQGIRQTAIAQGGLSARLESRQRLPEEWRRGGLFAKDSKKPLFDPDPKTPLEGYRASGNHDAHLHVYQAALNHLSPAVLLATDRHQYLSVTFDPGSYPGSPGRIKLPEECFRRHQAGETVKVIANGEPTNVVLTDDVFRRLRKSPYLTRFAQQFAVDEAFGAGIESIGRVSVNVPPTYPFEQFIQKVIYPLSEIVPVYQMLAKAKDFNTLSDTYDFVIIPQPEPGHQSDSNAPDLARKTPLIILSYGGFDSWLPTFGFDVRTRHNLETLGNNLGSSAQISPYNNGHTMNVMFDMRRYAIKLDFTEPHGGDLDWYSGSTVERIADGLVMSKRTMEALPKWAEPFRSDIANDNFGGGLAPAAAAKLHRPRVA